MNSTVGLQSCNTYDFDKVYDSIVKLFELVPPPDVKGKTVLLKPNILYPKKPELAVCTHPVVVGAAVKAFLNLGAKKVLVGESPAIANAVSAAKSTGMFDQVILNKGEWIDFKESVVVPCKEGRVVKQFNFAAPFTQADVLVSIAKLKTHQFMAYTGAMKNLFGLMVGLEKAGCHYRFPNKQDFGGFLTDLNLAAKPSYAIMDAIVGMEGPGGPGNGDPIQLNFLAASDNILALDWECAKLVGYDPHTIVNLEDALQRKVWLNSEKDIKTAGDNESQFFCPDFKIVKNASPTLQKMVPGWLNFIATKVFTKNPHFDAEKCIKCGRCQKICPAQLITMDGPDNTACLPQKSKCLHCYCCHEICPQEAINLKHF